MGVKHVKLKNLMGKFQILTRILKELQLHYPQSFMGQGVSQSSFE